jgi:hypothetical protein
MNYTGPLTVGGISGLVNDWISESRGVAPFGRKASVLWS